VPRGERPLESEDSELGRFAADLRRLRDKAGGLPYRELGRRAHYSAATLSEAASGRKLPTLAVTLAYVTACGGDVDEWEARWRSLSTGDVVEWQIGEAFEHACGARAQLRPAIERRLIPLRFRHDVRAA